MPRHADRIADDDGELGEGQVEGEGAPGPDREGAAGGHGARHDRAVGQLGEERDAGACVSRRTRRNVSGHGEGGATLQRAERAAECGRAAAVLLRPSRIARAPHHAHAEAPEDACEHLRISVAGDDDGDVGFRLRLDHRHHQELPMPHGEDLRVLGEQFGVDVGRIAHHFAGAEHEADIGLGKSAAQARYQSGMMQRRQKTHDTSWADLYTRSRLIGSSLASVTIGRSSVSPVHVMAMNFMRYRFAT